MHSRVCSLLASGLALLSNLVSSSPIVPHYFRAVDVSRAVSPKQVQNDLGRTLSKGALIFGPSSPAFAEATGRWSTRSMPQDIQVVIEVAQESDVAKIVKYCYQNSIDFLAYSRGHGSSSTISKFRGIEINLSKLTKITIQPDKKSALFQGGVYADLSIKKLWNDGYIAPTGSNGCVGLLGPALGGGLGRYQGQHGLISDNFISLNVVLANGTAITVSTKSNSDLFWAMKGAGHNFGIVTSAYIKIYPRKASTWHYHNYVWSQDKLEKVFEALDKFQGKGQIPALMGVNFGQFSIEPDISKTEAVIIWSFAYDGPAADAEKLLAPFNAIPAISSTKDDVSYPDLLVAQQTDINSASCSSQPYVGSTTWLQTYNVSSQREIYKLFNKRIAQNPGLAPGARVFFEGYSSKATQAIDPSTSSYPHRDEYLLVFFAVAAPPQLEGFARAWADKTVDIWHASQPGRRRATYVNYAVGNESLESIYGYDGQLSRLRALKAKYDPRNKFRWYNPIVTY
ncbi:FAD-binding domain and SignalP-predicted secretion signal [Trichoderma parareesei]|uniref:FAD-binding domain and SignalP-predicted secretion signal n=1 Tax=Trichoderma parareesei TaxID=858221 RepID=A0A2H2ZNB5_TRIPA|nr:FAD-binding domain and SignalP-predicted secretion signal [Trichoderma parareesei]